MFNKQRANLLGMVSKLGARPNNEHNAVWITGKSASNAISLVAIFVILVIGVTLWHLAVIAPESDVGFYYSSPSVTFDAFFTYFWKNLEEASVTAVRGFIGVLVGFYIVYPLGSLLALSGYFSNLSRLFIMMLLALPLLVIIMFFMTATGLTLKTVVIVGWYTAFVKMIAFGFFNTQDFITAEKNKDMIQQVVLDGANRWTFYSRIVSPLLYQQRIHSLYILSAVVWNSVTFTEAYVGGHIGGIGVILQRKSEQFGTMSWFYSASIMLLILIILGWAVIYFISQWYARRYE